MDGEATLPRLERANLGEEAYRVLRDHIFSYRFAGGERLDLPSIGRQLGISRTPLKAALDRLASEGLVKTVPRRGTYVAIPSLETIENAFGVREVLETYAVARSVECMTEGQLERLARTVKAMLRTIKIEDHAPIYLSYAELDYDFHALIVEAANNDVLTELWGRVHARVQIARVRYGRGDRKLDLITREHQGILAACQARDVKTTEALVREHIRRAKASLQVDLQNLDGS
jgi:DNA-binding GntR family transcriptional regulator